MSLQAIEFYNKALACYPYVDRTLAIIFNNRATSFFNLVFNVFAMYVLFIICLLSWILSLEPMLSCFGFPATPFFQWHIGAIVSPTHLFSIDTSAKV
jgi:hypothetical protein